MFKGRARVFIIRQNVSKLYFPIFCVNLIPNVEYIQCGVLPPSPKIQIKLQLVNSTCLQSEDIRTKFRVFDFDLIKDSRSQILFISRRRAADAKETLSTSVNALHFHSHREIAGILAFSRCECNLILSLKKVSATRRRVI